MSRAAALLDLPNLLSLARLPLGVAVCARDLRPRTVLGLMAAAGVNWVFNQTYTEGEKSLLEAVKLCVELGMDVNAANSMGLTPVMGAANRGSDSIIEYLVSQGARLDVKDATGRTPYNWAEGVFLATHSPVPKPSSMALIQKLSAK